MKLSHFFIDRPIFGIVISIVTILLGAIAYTILPVAQFPEIAPPTVVVQAQYPGADPKTLADTVAEPIEQQVNGVENMLYMSSVSAMDGTMQLTVTFKLGTDPNIAQVLVQNRVAIAQPQLPLQTRNIGVTTQKQSPDILMAIGLTSKSNTYTPLYLSNYAYTQIEDSLKRIDGVGNVLVWGAQPYSMRVWLNPDLMFSRGLTVDDVVSAVQAQNVQVAPGSIGAEPARPKTEFQFILNTKGRLITPEQFSKIILKRGDNGQLVYLGDVARLELGGQNYTSTTYQDGLPAVAIGIFQLPGSNELKTAALVKKQIAEMAKSFPPGMEYSINYDPTLFTQQSIDAVYDTLRTAIVLVVIVVMLFLQSWRIALIPLIAVPVSLIGTFAVMALMGFSLNSLSLFGLILAIGIVVDDAIVVVENVQRWIEHGLDPKEATRKAMDEVGGAVISIAVVLTAVFVPTALVSGISGQFYRQFALTIAIATLISAFNSLTLSPALAALLIKPGHAKKDLLSRLIDTLLGWFFRLFNRTFDLGIAGYGAVVRRLLRVSGLVLVVYIGLLALTGLMFQKVPGGFIPTMDQGYLVVFAQLPDGASLQRTDDVQRQIAEIGKNTPGVERTFAIEGLSVLDSTTKSNALTSFFLLKPFSERIGHPEQSATAIGAKLQSAFSAIQDAFVVAIQPPSVRGMGNAGGFQLEIEDHRNAGLSALQQATDAVTAAANAEPGLSSVFTTYRSRGPQLFLNIDREKVQSMNVPISSVFNTLQSYLGSNYVGDFNFLGRTYQVNLQGDAAFRSDPNQILRMYARNNTGGMVPLGSLMDVQRINGPDTVGHYNVYPAALIQGTTLPGISSGQAIEKMERICRENLPSQFSFEWTQLTYQEVTAGNTAVFIFPLCVLFVFLALAAQYENWSLPLAVILIVPMCLLSAMAGVYFRGQDNNIFTQIGFIVLVGLACKNAILIVEFARQEMLSGKGRIEAAAEAARLRLRPILMTSFAFILGVLPLVIAKGAGAEMDQALGTAVFAGMIGVTFFGIFFTPVFFSVIMKIFARASKKKQQNSIERPGLKENPVR
ncbi:MAG TPA: multidrug efflux RND transporter permease subunit [Chthoniobacterales bacterium]|nr:multidrug efflux RND transporter permease subunit [Chthoniobacterales bacterium]